MNIDHSILETSELDKTTKHFLHTLASFCDASGECYPKQETIAKYMSTSIRTVQRCLRLCVELGLVKVRRRWRRASIYKVLCLVKRKLSTMATHMAQQNKPPCNFKNDSQKNGLKIPKEEWAMCFQDSIEVLGKRTVKKNKGWLSILIRKAGSDLFMESLRWVRSMMLEGEASGSPIANPGGLQTWFLRRQGVEV